MSRAAQAFVAATALGGIVLVVGPGPAGILLALATAGMAGAALVLYPPSRWSLKIGYGFLLVFLGLWAYVHLESWRLSQGGADAVRRLAADKGEDLAGILAARLEDDRLLAERVSRRLADRAERFPAEVVQDPELFVALGRAASPALRPGTGLEIYDAAGSLRAWWGDPRGDRLPADSAGRPLEQPLVRRPSGFTLAYTGAPWIVRGDSFRVIVKDVWRIESPLGEVTDPDLVLPALQEREGLSFRVMPVQSGGQGVPIMGPEGPVGWVEGQRFMVERFLEERRLGAQRLLGLLFLWPLAWSVGAVWQATRRGSGPRGRPGRAALLTLTGRLALVTVVWAFLMSSRYLTYFLPPGWFSPLGFAAEMLGPGGRSAGDLLTTAALALLFAVGAYGFVPARRHRSTAGTVLGVAAVGLLAWLIVHAAAAVIENAIRGMSLDVFFSTTLLFSPHYLMVLLAFALFAGVVVIALAAGLRPLGVPADGVRTALVALGTLAVVAGAAWILPAEALRGRSIEFRILLALGLTGTAWLVHAAGLRRFTGKGAGPAVALIAVTLGGLVVLPLLSRARIDVAQDLLVERAERLGESSGQWLQYTMSRMVEYLAQSSEAAEALEEGNRDAALLLWSRSPLRSPDFASGLYLVDDEGEIVSQFALTTVDLGGRARARAEADNVRVDVEGAPEEGGIWWATVPLYREGARLGAAVAMSTGATRLREAPSGATFLLSDLMAGSSSSFESTLYRTLEPGETPPPRTLLTSVQRPDGTRVRLALPLGRLLPGARTYALFAVVAAICGLLVGIVERWTDPRARVRSWGRARAENPLRSFRVQLLLAFVAVAALPLTLYAVLGFRATRAEVQESTRAAATEALGAASRLLVGDTALEQGTARALNSRLRQISDVLQQDLILYWRGRAVASSRPEIFASRLFADRMKGEVYTELFAGGRASVFDSVLLGERSFLVAYRPLREAGAPAGYVLATPLLIREDQARQDLQRLGEGVFLLTAFSIAFLLVVGWGLARFMARPLGALEQGTRQIASGRLAYRLPPPARQDEFGHLQEAFNTMAERLDKGQRALEEEKSRVQAILSSVGAGVVALDADGQVQLLNERAASLLGERPEAVLGQRAGELARRRDGASRFWGLVERQLAGGRADRELVLRREGKDRHYHVVFTTLREAGGEDERGLVVAFEDITDNVASQRVLAWGEMARQVAHEIKNPLTPMKLSLQHLERTVDERPLNFEHLFRSNLDLVLAEIDRLERIAGNFSRFAVPDPRSLVSFDPVLVARDALTLFEATEEVVVYGLETVGEPKPILGEPEGFRRVLVNLLQNARDAVVARGGGRVDVRLDWEREPGWARVSVLDDGIGLPDTDLERLFEPSFSTKTRGTGLGLAITRRIVEAWGGTIEYERREGGGTAIHARLRLAQQE
ncbi:MAG TPA: ATP-binding protein [Gemmatimonadota bacterium]|nr:ATP-binding protein [Gemmatimonadota bacterium]